MNLFRRLTPRPMGALLPAMLVFAGCAAGDDSAGTAENAEPQTTILAGTITNPNGDNVKISVADTSFATTLAANGKFRLAYPLAKADYANLRIGQESTMAWVTPGDSLHIALDGTLFDETVTYSGPGAGPANYLAAKYLVIEKMADERGNPYELPEADFLAYTDEKRDIMQRTLAAADVSADFSAAEQTDIQFEWAMERANYPEYHRYYADAPDYVASADYWAFIDQLDLNNPANADSKNFQVFASAYMDAKVSEGAAEDMSRSDRALARMDLIATTFTEPSLRDDLLTNTVTGYMRYDGADGADVLMARLRAAGVDKESLASAETMFEEWSRLATGKPAPAFGGATTDGTEMTLADLAGKVVYVDVWATWCGPCLREIPSLRELQAEFEGDDRVVFLSISVDEDHQSWLDMVAEKELGGSQWFAEGAWQSDVVKKYKIAGIPRFFMVGADGNIVTATAPRPTSGEVADLIREQLEAQLAAG